MTLLILFYTVHCLGEPGISVMIGRSLHRILNLVEKLAKGYKIGLFHSERKRVKIVYIENPAQASLSLEMPVSFQSEPALIVLDT